MEHTNKQSTIYKVILVREKIMNNLPDLNMMGIAWRVYPRNNTQPVIKNYQSIFFIKCKKKGKCNDRIGLNTTDHLVHSFLI